MQIELSQDEIDTINTALECWEKESHTGALIGGIMSAIMLGDKNKAEREDKMESSMRKADDEGKRRKAKSLLLRAKLMQAITATLTKS